MRHRALAALIAPFKAIAAALSTLWTVPDNRAGRREADRSRWVSYRMTHAQRLAEARYGLDSR